MRAAAILLLTLTACDGKGTAPADIPSTLEEAAIERGLIVDPAARTMVGVFAREDDRLCIGPGAGQARTGLAIRYDAEQGCVARGMVAPSGTGLRFDLGQGCVFDAGFDGTRIAFPGALPEGCQAACTGRASLAGFSADRLSGSAAEAAALRGPEDEMLCAEDA